MQVYATDAIMRFDPFWSGDGERIYFPYQQRGAFDLWSVPASGGVATRVTNVGGSWSSLHATPDGRRAAFTRDAATEGREAWFLDLDGAGEDFGASADFFLYLGTRLPGAARNADAVLPIATFAEMDGTFTNFEGRVQRFHQALRPPGLARPGWMVLSRVLARLGDGEALNEVRGAFERMAAEAPAFAGLTWDGIGLKGAPAAGAAAEAAGVAGATGAAGTAEADA